MVVTAETSIIIPLDSKIDKIVVRSVRLKKVYTLMIVIWMCSDEIILSVVASLVKRGLVSLDWKKNETMMALKG